MSVDFQKMDGRIEAAELALRHGHNVEAATETLEEVMQDAEDRGLDDIADHALGVLMRHGGSGE